MRILLLLSLLIPSFFISGTVVAEIEKLAIPSPTGIQTYWWPKLPKVEGWEHNREASINYSSNFQLPVGETLNEAETVIYARAIYKPKQPEIESIEQLIDEDKKKFFERDPNMRIVELPNERAKNETLFRVFELTPEEGRNWEIVSFADEEDFYLIFVVSSRSQQGLEKSMPKYLSFLRNYE